MKKTALLAIILLILLISIVAGTQFVSWYHSSLKIDDSWVANVTQFLEEAKPYPEWKDEYTLYGYTLWLSENGSEQFIGAPSSDYNFIDFLEMLLSKANTQTVSFIATSEINNMLEANRVLKAQFRFGCYFPAWNKHVWNAYFVLDDGLNQGLKGTIFVYGLEYGVDSWSGWKFAPFPFPTTLVVATSLVVVAVSVSLLIYLMKRRHWKLTSSL